MREYAHWNTCSKVCSSFIKNSPKLEKKPKSTNRRMDKYIVVYSYNGAAHSNKEQTNDLTPQIYFRNTALSQEASAREHTVHRGGANTDPAEGSPGSGEQAGGPGQRRTRGVFCVREMLHDFIWVAVTQVYASMCKNSCATPLKFAHFLFTLQFLSVFKNHTGFLFFIKKEVNVTLKILSKPVQIFSLRWNFKYKNQEICMFHPLSTVSRFLKS